jgi:hypothetical protein
MVHCSSFLTLQTTPILRTTWLARPFAVLHTVVKSRPGYVFPPSIRQYCGLLFSSLRRHSNFVLAHIPPPLMCKKGHQLWRRSIDSATMSHGISLSFGKDILQPALSAHRNLGYLFALPSLRYYKDVGW